MKIEINFTQVNIKFTFEEFKQLQELVTSASESDCISFDKAIAVKQKIQKIKIK